MEKSLPLNTCNPRKTQIIINRLHTLTHGTALLLLFYYRIKSLISTPFLPHFLIFISELILSFLWLLCQPSKWIPVNRTAYPERLPGDDKLPAIDVFICTVDPKKEPSVDVMNTLISALALDYPPEKLHVYLSDDGGSPVTLRAVKEAWMFMKIWIPFCRKYEVKNRCPEAYFFREDDEDEFSSSEFLAEKKNIEKQYGDFKISVANIVADTTAYVSTDHPSIIEVISDSDNKDMPLLIYAAREKRPSHPHHFKAGALNVLLRVSAMISNSPYILVLDCDMYCNSPTSARDAMCFHLDSKLSPNLGWVQFPQIFHNISETDIYDGQLRFVWPKFEGFDGLGGPIVSGTNFYIKREVFYGSPKFKKDVDLVEMKEYFGSSNEFIKSIHGNYKTNFDIEDNVVKKELQILASCSYDDDTKWGKEVGFRYFTVVEDFFTSLHLHCEGWKSVYYQPSRPCFLGATPIGLGEVFIQHTRWNVGFNQVAMSKYSPLLYGPRRMSIFLSMCYAELAYYPLYFLALHILALVPALCLLRGMPLYPEVSSPFFWLFSFIFLSSQLKHIQEVSEIRNPIRVWSIEQRMWMYKSLASYLYATLDAVKEKLGLTKASFLPTNKVGDDDIAKRYQMGVYDFQASALFMVPLCILYMINLAAFVVGFVGILRNGKGNEMVIETFIPLFGVVLQFPLFEGMVLRKDQGRVSPCVVIVSASASLVVLFSAFFAN